MSPCTRSTTGLGSANDRSRKLRGKTRKPSQSDRRVSWRLSELKAEKIGASGIGLNQRNRTAIMPSGEIRRGTRVIGMVKGADAVRVLRSGRRLFPGSGERQVRRVKDDEDELLHHSIKQYQHKCKENGVTNDDKLKRKAAESVVHANSETESPIRMKRARLAAKKVKKVVSKSDKVVVTGEQVAVVDKMFGIVYTRKRKRASIEKQEGSGNKMFGIQFSRRQVRKKGTDSGVGVPTYAFVAVFQNSGTGVASLLTSIFRQINDVGAGLSELAGFLFSEPLNGTFASNGIRFLQDSPGGARSGICTFFDSATSVSSFDLDFSVIPSWFLHMHMNRVLSMSRVPLNKSSEECDEMMSEDEVDQLFVIVKTPQIELASEADISENRPMLTPSVRSSRLTVKSTHSRNAHYSRVFRKSRSSRRRRARNPSLLGVHTANGLMVTSSAGSRKNSLPLTSVVSMYKLRNALPASCMTAGPKESGSAIVGGTNCTADKASCYADLLVIDLDRCYRMKGATIAMESSVSKESVLVVKKDDETKLSFLPQKYMRPSSCNRITHNVMWSGNENWKLEFSSRQDWSNFKELYKECANLNVPRTTATCKAIPVPGVREVPGYENNCFDVFSMPDAYISVTTDEATRALAKRTANYDMDSEDERWLKACSLESAMAVGHPQLLSEDKFELMIDVFEKASYCSSDEVIDEKAALSLVAELAGQEVAEAVYSYWLKKRKQRRSALLRVFQSHQVKKAPVIAKLILRKRRSFKRQGGQCGKGKQLGLLQAMAIEHDALEERNAMVKLEGANKTAKRSMELAIEKRRRAQMLMENASLLCYKATMALRIAEALSAFDSAEVATTEMFDVGKNGGDDE